MQAPTIAGFIGKSVEHLERSREHPGMIREDWEAVKDVLNFLLVTIQEKQASNERWAKDSTYRNTLDAFCSAVREEEVGDSM